MYLVARLLLFALVLAPGVHASDDWGLSADQFATRTHDKLVVAEQLVRASVRNGVATVEIRQKFREAISRVFKSEQRVFNFVPGLFAVPFGYRISPESSSRDAGLLETDGYWSIKSTLIPPIANEVSFSYDQAMRVNSDGILEFSLACGDHPVKKLTIDVRATDPRGIDSITADHPLRSEPPAPGGQSWRVSLELANYFPPSKFDVRIHLIGKPRGLQSSAFGEGRFLVSYAEEEKSGTGGPLAGAILIGRSPGAQAGVETILGKSWARNGSSGVHESVPLKYEAAAATDMTSTWNRLYAAAKVSEAVDQGVRRASASVAVKLAREASIVSPWTALASKPGEAARVEDRVLPADKGREPPAGLVSALPLDAATHFFRLSIAKGWITSFLGLRSRGTRRACFSNQKTIAGAIEMYLLDSGLRMEQLARLAGCQETASQNPFQPAMGVEAALVLPLGRPFQSDSQASWMLRIEPAFWNLLKSEGYLQTIVQDPEEGEGSHVAYVLTGFSPGVFCMKHGSFQADTGSSREQLAAAGVSDPKWLAQASPEYDRGSQADFLVYKLTATQLGLTVFGGLLLLLVVTLSLGTRGVAPRQAALHAGKSGLYGILVWMVEPIFALPLLIWATAVVLAAAALASVRRDVQLAKGKPRV